MLLTNSTLLLAFKIVYHQLESFNRKMGIEQTWNLYKKTLPQKIKTKPNQASKQKYYSMWKLILVAHSIAIYTDLTINLCFDGKLIRVLNHGSSFWERFVCPIPVILYIPVLGQ